MTAKHPIGEELRGWREMLVVLDSILVEAERRNRLLGRTAYGRGQLAAISTARDAVFKKVQKAQEAEHE